MATLCVPHPVPSAMEDAQKLRKAFEGWGTDEKTVIDILTHRNAEQRTQIRLVYEEEFKENFFKRLESELSGHFEKAVYRWVFAPVQRQALLAHNAIISKEFDFLVIVEIACVNSPDELLAVKKMYQALYKHSMEEDIASYTTGNIRALTFALVGTYRYGGDEIDTVVAQSEAKILNEAINKGDFNDQEIIRILSTRSKAQLNATFNCFKDANTVSITKALVGETPNDFALALRSLIRCIINPAKYYEKVVRNALQHHHKDEDTLTRVIVTRTEKDLKEIKELFHKRANVTLEQTVANETHGDYKHFLLALIGN
ncbi:hypothetical protein LUZ60_011183 [Juncus effusus]|nr:hypothetical protein LUZ60_011183 [Juncus effusus]